MTKNPYIRYLVTEAKPVAGVTPENNIETGSDEAANADVDDDTESTAELPKTAPLAQKLLKQWQKGDQTSVAVRLLFTRANYIDLVDLLFAVGYSEGRKLGQLLDQIADIQNLEVPQTPPQYRELLQQILDKDHESIL
jgi:hypothetical protein